MRIKGPFWVYKRPKTRKFQITLYPASGLPPEICKKWKRRGFSRLPLELAVFRESKTKAAADAGALALIEYLKNQIKQPEDVHQIASVENQDPRDEITVRAWLEKFVSLENNPRSDRLIGKKSLILRGLFPCMREYSGYTLREIPS
jgi:hypothetical protein